PPDLQVLVEGVEELRPRPAEPAEPVEVAVRGLLPSQPARLLAAGAGLRNPACGASLAQVAPLHGAVDDGGTGAGGAAGACGGSARHHLVDVAPVRLQRASG